MTLQLPSRTPSLLQDSASLGKFGLTAKSGFIQAGEIDMISFLMIPLQKPTGGSHGQRVVDHFET